MNKELTLLEWCYPEQYSHREREGLKKLEEQCKKINDAPISDLKQAADGAYCDHPGVQACRDDFGAHAKPLLVERDQCLHYADIYDPDNPVYHDPEYARRMGFRDIIAMPGYGYNDHRFMFKMPPEMRDVMAVSGLYHELTFHLPQYPGDTLISLRDKQIYRDITPKQGARFHTFLLEDWGRVINQNGDLVMEVYDRVCESCGSYLNSKDRENKQEWMTAPWQLLHPAHYYTDEDWEKIKDMWSRESRRGEEILYWEDVNIGDEPAWTVEGPVDRGPEPDDYYGMGAGAGRCSYRKELMDPERAKLLVRNEKDGIYRAVGDNGSDTPPWGDSNDPQGDHRNTFINFLGRDLVCRCINNYMGDHGFIHKLCWGIMPCLPTFEADIPRVPNAVHWLDQVPYMKGKEATTHPMQQDLAICKMYVTGKKIENSLHLVELVWWIETLEGDIWMDGKAEIVLPGRV